MKIQKYIHKNKFIISFAAVFLLIAAFGSLEIVRHAPLSLSAQFSMLLLFLVVGTYWIRKGQIEWLLYLYIFIQPLTRFPAYVLGPIRLSFVLLALTVVGFCFLVWKKRQWHSFRAGKLVFPQMLFVGVVCLSTLINVTYLHSFERIILHISNLFFVLVVLQIIDDAKKLIRFVSVWCASVTFMAVFGVIASLVAQFQGVTTSPFIQTSIDGIIRIQSLTPDSNYFAVLLFIPLCLGLACVLTQKAIVKKSYKIFFWCLVPLLIATMLITYSRAGLLALMLALASFVFFERQYFRYVFWVKFGTLIVSGILLAMAIQPEFVRNMIMRAPDSVISQDQKIQYGTALTFDKSKLVFRGNGIGLYGTSDQTGQALDPAFQENIADDAIDVRGLYWGVAVKMFKASPLYGLGAGEYPYQFERYLGYNYFAKLPNTHEIFLETAAEFGVIGLAALIFLMIRSLLLLRALYQFSDGPKKVFLYGIGVAYVASLFQYCFQPSFNSMNLWFVISVLGVTELLSVAESKKLNILLTSSEGSNGTNK
jgi:predicted membrane protein